MTGPVAVIVAGGIGLALVAGLSGGFDAVSAVMLAFIVGLGALGIAVSRRAEAGGVSPKECGECGGLTSPNAPYCKHCGTHFSSG